ncbi:MAG: prephenate dehydrogenase [bacterium]|nr:prephenate dehydrogenase [bacterium]
MRIAVIGTGHMGMWFIRELAKSHPVAVFDTDSQKMEAVSGDSIVKLELLSELETFRPQMVVNAVSLKNTVEAFQVLLPYLGGECMLVDIATIKGSIPDFYEICGRPFVSVHPMFGPRFTDLHSLKGENAVIISESHEDGKEFFREFFRDFGLTLFEYTFAQHDRLMGRTLTLPFASSIVFSACVTGGTVPGTTYKRHKEIARKLMEEDDYLLAEVLFNAVSLEQVEKITSSLEFSKHVIRDRDHEEAGRFFKRLRKNLE